LSKINGTLAPIRNKKILLILGRYFPVFQVTSKLEIGVANSKVVMEVILSCDDYHAGHIRHGVTWAKYLGKIPSVISELYEIYFSFYAALHDFVYGRKGDYTPTG
jgi:hypothetical protein